MFISILFVLAWVIIATYADTCFKQAANIGSRQFLTGLLCYSSTAFLAIATFKRQQWGWIIITWNCSSLAISMILAVVMFREPFTIRRMVASVLVLIAILLAE